MKCVHIKRKPLNLKLIMQKPISEDLNFASKVHKSLEFTIEF